MYFLLKLWIFQPAMFVYQQVFETATGNIWVLSANRNHTPAGGGGLNALKSTSDPSKKPMASP